MKKVAFTIQKGGTGKTTLSGNCAYAAARTKKTVLVDCDPQGNSSSWFLTKGVAYELADVLKGEVKVQDAVVQVGKFYMIPTFGLDGNLKQYGENQLNDEPFIFEDLCSGLEVQGFQVAIFDLSPGMSKLEKCVILAMDEVITPLTPEFFSVDGISIFNAELQKINRSFRKNVQHRTVVANNVNRRFRRHNVYYKQFQDLKYKLFTVGQDAKLAESQMYNKSIFEYYPESKTIPELEKLTADIIGG
ncbi:Chromosome-partitioning ATPase Soj [subsurface metagenome]